MRYYGDYKKFGALIRMEYCGPTATASDQIGARPIFFTCCAGRLSAPVPILPEPPQDLACATHVHARRMRSGNRTWRDPMGPPTTVFIAAHATGALRARGTLLAISAYLRSLRARIGHDPVLLPSVAVMVRDAGGRLLLVRNRDDGRWQTVGGGMDPGEQPADAAVREAYEETGLLVEPTRVIGVYAGPDFRLTYPNGDVVDYVGISFAARVVGGAERPCDDEVDRLGWFDRSEAQALPMARHTRTLVGDAFREQTEPVFTPPTWRPPA